jgi:ATP-dependent RNA helicase DDX19/DBP5
MVERTSEINIENLKIADSDETEVANQFEEIAEKNKELKDETKDVVVASTVGVEAPENLLKTNDKLFSDESWDSLGIPEKLLEGLIDMNFSKPSKIQATTYPLITKNPPTHLLAQSHNGSGKTGAFGLGTLSRIDEKKNTLQAVIFAHTRELVNQITKVLTKMAKFTNIKVTALDKTSKKNEIGHVIVTTPGNFETMAYGRKILDLSNLKVLVLDEADFMLTNDITKSVCEKTFKKFINESMPVQVLFFSATFKEQHFKDVKKFFKRAYIIEVKKEALTLGSVRQMFYQCKTRDEKVNFIEEYLKRSIENERVIIFVNSRDYVAKLQQLLSKKGYRVFILMGGEMSPEERDLTIEKFNQGEIQILITTNVLARGFDEQLVKLVINFDLPLEYINGKVAGVDAESYLHRIGRTGRFLGKGIGLTLISDEKELAMLKQIEKHYSSNIEEIESLDTLMAEFKKIIEDKF